MANPRRSGLGKGLGALIPQVEVEEIVTTSRPLDVFFPAGAKDSDAQRGGSARDLLTPRKKKTQTGKASRKKVSSSEVKLEAANTPTTVSQGGIAETQIPKSSDRQLRADEISRSAGSSPAEQKDSSKRLFADLLEGDVSRETSGAISYAASYAELPLELIVPNTRQPRVVFDEDDLQELVASIKEVGVLQPVVVRPIPLDQEPSERLKELLEDKPNARFELIMGERRLRASEHAGMENIPAIIRHTEDGDLLRDALLENLHRAQLNPLEEAAAYKQLMEDFGVTQEQLAPKVARSRPQITNTLRLLKLPGTVQNKVASGIISAGHARALLSLTTPSEMEILADRIIAEGLSVRTTEELVRLGRVKAAAGRPQKVKTPASPLALTIAEALEDRYETRVTVTEGRSKGRISIEFAGREDLQRIADIILGNSQ